MCLSLLRSLFNSSSQGSDRRGGGLKKWLKQAFFGDKDHASAKEKMAEKSVPDLVVLLRRVGECHTCDGAKETNRLLHCGHVICIDCLQNIMEKGDGNTDDVVAYHCQVCGVTFMVPGGAVENLPTVLSGRCLLASFINKNEVDSEPNVSPKDGACKVHVQNYATFCLTCDIPICPSCLASNHRKHKLAFITDGVCKAVEKYQKRLTKRIDQAAKELEKVSTVSEDQPQVRSRDDGGECDALVGRNSSRRQERERLSTFMIKLTQMRQIVELIMEDTSYDESRRLALVRDFLKDNADLIEGKLTTGPGTGALLCLAVEEIHIAHEDDCHGDGLGLHNRYSLEHTLVVPSVPDFSKDGPASTSWPYNIALLKDGGLVIREKLSGMIMVFRCRTSRDLTSAYIACIFKGRREYRLSYPKDIATHEDRIFVLDAKAMRLVVFTSHGEGLGVIPLPGKPGALAIHDGTAYIGYKGLVEAYQIVETDFQTPRVVLQRMKSFALPKDSWPWYMTARSEVIAINLKGKALIVIKDDVVSPVYDVMTDSADLRGLVFLDDGHLGVVNGKTKSLTSYPVRNGLDLESASDILTGLDSPSDVSISEDGNIVVGQDSGIVNVYFQSTKSE